MRSHSSRMFVGKRFGAAVIVLGALLALLAGTALAEERISFKNGRTLVVKAIREEGNMVYVTLLEGGEVGFPKSLVLETQQTQAPQGPINHNYAGRGPTYRELAERYLATSGMPLDQVMRLQGSMAKDDKGRTATVGFSYRGSQDVGSLPPDVQNQGTNIRDFFRQRRAAKDGQQVPGQALPGLQPLKTFTPPDKKKP